MEVIRKIHRWRCKINVQITVSFSCFLNSREDSLIIGASIIKHYSKNNTRQWLVRYLSLSPLCCFLIKPQCQSPAIILFSTALYGLERHCPVQGINHPMRGTRRRWTNESHLTRVWTESLWEMGLPIREKIWTRKSVFVVSDWHLPYPYLFEISKSQQ